MKKLKLDLLRGGLLGITKNRGDIVGMKLLLQR